MIVIQNFAQNRAMTLRLGAIVILSIREFNQLVLRCLWQTSNWLLDGYG